MGGEENGELLLDELVYSVKKNLGKDFSEEFIRDLLNAAWQNQHEPNQEKLNLKINKILEEHNHMA